MKMVVSLSHIPPRITPLISIEPPATSAARAASTICAVASFFLDDTPSITCMTIISDTGHSASTIVSVSVSGVLKLFLDSDLVSDCIARSPSLSTSIVLVLEFGGPTRSGENESVRVTLAVPYRARYIPVLLFHNNTIPSTL